METILDHNITDEEWEDLFGIKMSRSEYLDELDQRKAYDHLFYLYQSRGEKLWQKNTSTRLQMISTSSLRYLM